MAVRDHKDLLSRSQDLSLSFIQHFIEHEEPWYIKDSLGRYVLASYSFCELSGLPFSKIKGKTVSQLLTKKSCISLEQSKYENYALNDNGTVYSLEVGYFNCDDFLSVRFFIVKPFKHLSESLTITYIRKPEGINFSTIVHGRVGIKSDASLIEKPLSKISICQFQTFNPMEEVTEKQWEAAWLILCGLSVSDVAKMNHTSTTAVKSKLNAMYAKLNVFSKNDFIYIANYYDWICYIPRSLLLCEKSVLLKVLYK